MKVRCSPSAQSVGLYHEYEVLSYCKGLFPSPTHTHPRVQPEAGPSKGERPPTAPVPVCAGQIPGTTSALVRNWKRPSDQSEEQGQGPGTEPPARARAFLAEVKQMRARRKTAKMLMVVLLVFALCYLPISVLNVLKR